MGMADTNDTMEVTAEAEKRQKPTDEVRRRKKHVYASLRKQMEFYFGDANLSKDRFLSNLLQRDKYVDLEIFLRFNRIRALTSNVSDIAKALRESELLSTTEDGTKVFRTTPVKYRDNADECTIYVEQLPPDADHEWLERVFSAYGEVVYVSIPKYRQSNKIKGFAFVEFETPEAATKTLEAFGAMGCRLPAQMPPDNLCSVAAFEEPCENNENKQHIVKTENCDSVQPLNEKKRKLEHPDSSIDSETGTATGPGKKKKKKKQKGNEGEEILQEDVKKEEPSEAVAANTETVKLAKKRKIEGENSQMQETDTESKPDKATLSSYVPVCSSADELEQAVKIETEVKKLKREPKEDIPSGEECEMDAECPPDESKTESTTGEAKKKKKNRNRNHKKKVKRESDPSKLGLKILSKREWKRLRNKYLDLQRKKMKAVKQHLARARWSGHTPHAYSEDGEATPNQQHEIPQPQLEAPRTVFTPGVIARIVFDQPVTDVAKLKSDLRAHADVRYVDVLEGANEAYVRFSSPSFAAQFVKEASLGSVGILSGEEETNYWNKIQQDRISKFSQKIKVKQRGRDKLLKRVERELGKHIRFDE